MTRRCWISISSLACCALLFAGAVCGAPPKQAATVIAPNADTRCIASSALPATLRSLAASPDCATGFTVLQHGTAVAGTLDGNIAVADTSGIRTYATHGSGPVTALSTLAWTTDDTYALVAYVVDEGIGVFDPQGGRNITFAGHAFSDKGGRSVSGVDDITDGQFLKMRPVPGRPSLTAAGIYALMKPDGQDETLLLDHTPGQDICAWYITAPGMLPEMVCSDVSDEFPPGLRPTPPGPPPTAGPSNGHPCSASDAATADAAHTIRVTIGDDSIEPASATINAGERYVITMLRTNPRVLNYLLLTDAAGRPIPDATGASAGVPASTSAGPVSCDFVAPTGGGIMYLEDAVRPHLRVEITDEIPGNPATPLSAAALETLTPFPHAVPSSAAPVKPVTGRSATPAPAR